MKDAVCFPDLTTGRASVDDELKAVRMHQEIIYHSLTLRSSWFRDNHRETSLAVAGTAGNQVEMF